MLEGDRRSAECRRSDGDKRGCLIDGAGSIGDRFRGSIRAANSSLTVRVTKLVEGSAWTMIIGRVTFWKARLMAINVWVAVKMESIDNKEDKWMLAGCSHALLAQSERGKYDGCSSPAFCNSSPHGHTATRRPVTSRCELDLGKVKRRGYHVLTPLTCSSGTGVVRMPSQEGVKCLTSTPLSPGM